MTTLKTLHDTDTGEPNRIKYKGEFVKLGFDVTEKGVAVLDCLSTYELHEGENEAYVDLDEVTHALGVVEELEHVGRVSVFEEVFHE